MSVPIGAQSTPGKIPTEFISPAALEGSGVEFTAELEKEIDDLDKDKQVTSTDALIGFEAIQIHMAIITTKGDSDSLTELMKKLSIAIEQLFILVQGEGNKDAAIHLSDLFNRIDKDDLPEQHQSINNFIGLFQSPDFLLDLNDEESANRRGIITANIRQVFLSQGHITK